MAVTGENSHKLQALTDKHKQVASLLTQGLGRTEISQVVEFTPEYVTWLCRDPLFKDYMRGLSEFHEARLEAMFGDVVNVVQDGLQNGTIDERLKAGRLQLEVTGRIGKNERPNQALDNSVERLNTLADRLLALQTKVRGGTTYEGQGQVIEQQQAITG